MRRYQNYRVSIHASYDGQEEHTTTRMSAASHADLAKDVLRKVNTRRQELGAENGSGSYHADPIDAEVYDASRHGAWGD